MKGKRGPWRAIILAAFMLLGVRIAVGQPRAVSLRLGWLTELAYHHTVGPGFIEGSLGVPWAVCPTATVSYNYTPWKFTNDRGGVFEFYGGGGVQFGTFLYFTGWSTEVYPAAGIVVPIGFQLRTSRHFLFALSWRPMFGLFFGDLRPVWYREGLYDGGITLGYAF